ncbi:MAG: PAS domain-containing sensor histidine kinase [Candidatus Magnetominusculus sp. LBB02]|nr:PAS domain-containing sensor histidine kinase [Candidatus Magnetominusculus sp. LBB02]
MSELSRVIGANMDVVLFIYGLSFVTVGFSIAFQSKLDSAFKWTGSLWLLAGFGLTHGLNEWIDMWILIKGGNHALGLVGWFVLTASFAFLFEFGRRVVRISTGESPSCKLLAAKYLGWWTTAGAVVLVIAIAALYEDFSTADSAAARYILGFPGSFITAYGFYSYYRCEKDLLSRINIKKYFIITSGAFFLYSILGGLVVSKVEFFPANILNTDLFLHVVGIPVQVLRAGVALIIVFSMINILKIFNWEIAKRQKEGMLKLQASEEKYRILLETIPDIVYMIDKDGIFLIVNNAVRFFGYEPEELIGKHFSTLISPEDVLSVSRNGVLSNTVPGTPAKLFDERRTGQRGTFGLEVHIVKKEGATQSGSLDTMLGEVNSSGVYEINEISLEKEFIGTLGLIKTTAVGGSTGVIRDITARKREMEELRKSQQQMEEAAANLQNMVNEEIKDKLKREQIFVQQSKLATMGEMIAVIAHQWRQPLNVIALIIQDIEDAFGYEGLDNDYLGRAVKSVFEQINFMTKTIDDFRNFLRPSKEKISFSLSTAIEETVFINEAMLRRKDIAVVFEKDDDYEITGYPNEFKHVILNLLNNARDAILSSNKDCGGKIDIGLKKDDNIIIITVSDNGGGIPPALIDKIFEPYFTTKPEQEGTGIGLYMSMTIIENRMGGRLKAKNTIGGAEFAIELQSES